MEIPLLGQGNGQRQQPTAKDARYALLVYVSQDGQVVLTTDLATPLTTERLPSPDEALGAVYAVLCNLSAQQVAGHTVNAMSMVGSQMAQMRASQEIAEKLKL